MLVSHSVAKLGYACLVVPIGLAELIPFLPNGCMGFGLGHGRSIILFGRIAFQLRDPLLARQSLFASLGETIPCVGHFQKHVPLGWRSRAFSHGSTLVGVGAVFGNF